MSRPASARRDEEEPITRRFPLPNGRGEPPRVEPAPFRTSTARRHDEAVLRLVGTVLDDRFELLRYVGDRGRAAAFEGVERPGGQRVAVQLFNTRSPSDPRFWREIARMREIDHRAAPRLLASDVLPGPINGPEQPYFVTTHVEGTSLRDHLLGRRTPATPLEVLTMLRPIGDALDRMHAGGVVHRDVRLDDIVVLEDGRSTSLTELGIALSLAMRDGRLTVESHLLASPHYIAPEAARGAIPSPSMDGYSLAVCAYELMAGVPPFAGTGLEVLTAKDAECAPAMNDVGPRAFSMRLEGAMRACLDREPKRRPPTAGGVLDRLTRALRD